MTYSVDPFRNHKNFVKFYFEIGCNVIIKAILWLTGGEEELKQRLEQALNKFNKDETERLKKYLDGDSKFNTFDLTVYFKICQIVCELAPVQIKAPRLCGSKVIDILGSNIIWTKSCPKHRQGELEYLLLNLKNGRNELAHPSIDHKNLTDLQVQGKCEEMKVLLTKIIEKSGKKAKNVSARDIQIEVKEMQLRLKIIKKDNDNDKLFEPHVRNLILKDLKKIYEKELESSFQKELRGYSVPYLRKQDKHENSRLSGIHFSSQVTVILGEAGVGKTALTKFLFHSWLHGNIESLKDLTEFDFVLRIQCNSIRSRDLNQFFEEHFLNAAFYFCNTSSLSRHFKDLKVLWIMDGFDESTPEFSGFLESVIANFLQLHKILITTRMHAFGNLKKYFPSMVSFNLDKLLDDNIEEIVKYLIYDDEHRESFKTKYNSLNMTEKNMLKTPIIFLMYIDLWQSSSNIEEGSITLTKLYAESTKLQLARLLESHQNKTQLVSGEDLLLSIENWFYGSLCKQSFLNIVGAKYILDCDEINNLKICATKGYLIPSACLSSFLESNLKKSRFNFKHSSQMRHFAALFMRKHPEDSSFDLEGDDFIDWGKIDLIKYFLEMVIEDDSANKSSEQTFDVIHKFILSFKEFDQGFLWHQIWVSTYLNPNIKDAIIRALQSCFYVDMRTLYHPSLIELIKHIEPNKIVIDTTDRYSPETFCSLISDDISVFLEFLQQIEYGKLQIELRPSISKNEEQKIKTQIMNRFKNAKHQLTYYEVVSSVVIQALRWLYVGEEPLEKHLVDLASDNTSGLSSRDINSLKELAKGNLTIEELDPALLLKVAKFIYEVDERNGSSWRKLWNAFTHDGIKFNDLISDFNSLSHPLITENINKDAYSNILPECERSIIRELVKEVVAHNISYTGVMKEEEELKKFKMTVLSTVTSYETSDVIPDRLIRGLLSSMQTTIKEFTTESNSTIKNDFDFSILKSILIGAGNGSNLDAAIINESIDYFQLRLRDLYSKTNFDIISTIHAKNIIIKELLTHYENDKEYYEKEMERYIPATLLDGDKKKNLSDISFEDFKLIIVEGKSGMGKSAMARYLFVSWARRAMESLAWLESFDIVFLVNGQRNQFKYMSERLQFLLPRSRNIFPTTKLLMKRLGKMSVLWICDGFDFSKSSMQSHLYRRFFKFHKFLFAAQCYKHCAFQLNPEIFEKPFFKFYQISLLNVENINIFLSKRIPESRVNAISDLLRSKLDECNDLLYNPCNLFVYVELLQNKTRGTLHLYSKCKLNETMLLVNQTNLRLQQLKDFCGYSDSKIDEWFYGSLCRQSFSIVNNRSKFTLQCKDIEKIERDAVKDNLDPITCLDFFLVKEHSGAEGVKYGYNHELQPWILASFFLRKLNDYPPIPENVNEIFGLIGSTVEMLNSFITMAIYEDLNEAYAIETASKVASANDLAEECRLWYNICAMNNFQDNVMKFVANILNILDCYVLHYVIQNISDITKFFTFFTPKAVKFTSNCWSKDKFSKEAYLDLLNGLKEKHIDILIGPINVVEPTYGNNGGVKVLDLINDESSLNVTFFEGKVNDLLLLGNHFGKLKKLNVRDLSADSYYELCRILPNMAEVSLSFVYFLTLNEIYPVNFVTRTTLICHVPELFVKFIEMIKRIKRESTSKFQRLIIKNWSFYYPLTLEDQKLTNREHVNRFQCIINNHFSEIEFAPENLTQQESAKRTCQNVDSDSDPDSSIGLLSDSDSEMYSSKSVSDFTTPTTALR